MNRIIEEMEIMLSISTYLNKKKTCTFRESVALVDIVVHLFIKRKEENWVRRILSSVLRTAITNVTTFFYNKI